MNLKKYCPIIPSLVFLCLGTAPGRGDTPYYSTASISVSNFTYREPGMKNTGPMVGLDVSFSKFVGVVYWDTDLVLEAGRVKYTSADTGSMGNNANVLFEARVVAGPSLNKMIPGAGTSWSIIPYAGIAYRFLDNDTEGKLTDTGFLGYDRRSNYLYSPLGLQVTGGVGQGGSCTMKAEYDLFWLGEQNSYLSPTITNHQNSGYGVRGSIALRHRGKTRDFIIEPFITYWNITKSKVVTIDTDEPGTVVDLWEPENTTMEIGCKFGISF